jgi:hypothetical protein
MLKAKEIFARLGFSDIIVPLEDSEKIYSSTDAYIVGYEDEDGEECEEDGIYINQPVVDADQIDIFKAIEEEESKLNKNNNF